MLTTVKPIVVTLTNLTSATGTYITYEVRMLYNTDNAGSTGEKTLYYGKSFVDADGTTEIHIEKVLRDYLWRWDIKYKATAQAYRPACMMGSVSNALQAVEYTEDLFFNTKIKVVYTYDDNEASETVDVCGAWCPTFQKMGTICGALEDAAITDYIQNYATLASGIVPRIPPVSTSNFWLGLVFGVNQAAEANVGTIALGPTSADTVDFTYQHGGTYAFAVSLAQLFQAMANSDLDGGSSSTSTYYDTIDGGDSTSSYTGSYDGGTSSESGYSDQSITAGVSLYLWWYVNGTLYNAAVAAVDECAAPYYVSWITPTGGWTSYGFEGNVSHGMAAEQNAITNLMGVKDVLSIKEQSSFSLHSKMVNAETYAHLMTMLSSRLLYVYDTENDVGYYCTTTTLAADTLPSKVAKPAAFQINLQTINVNEQ